MKILAGVHHGALQAMTKAFRKIRFRFGAMIVRNGASMATDALFADFGPFGVQFSNDYSSETICLVEKRLAF